MNSFATPASATLPTAERARLLDALLQQALPGIATALERTLASVDDYLFDRSQSGEEELGLFALRQMRRIREPVTQAFRQEVADGVGALRRLARDPLAPAPPPDLSLLSEEDLEEQLAVQQLSTAVLRGNEQAFELLGKRVAVLVGEAVPDAGFPFGPRFLAEALGRALRCHGMDDAALRVILFKFFERELAHAIVRIVDDANARLSEAGILPGLRATAAPPPPRRASGTHDAPAAAAAGTGAIGAAGAAGAAGAEPGGAEQALFATMLGMLQGWRSQAHAGQAVHPAGPALDTRDLMSVLSLMQRDGIAPRALSEGGDGSSLSGQLRQQVAQSARKLGVAGDNMQLDGLDGDAVDLVALLFDVLLDGPQYDSNIRSMMGRMLVPYVKVAVKDRRMFLYKEHPARRLLNTVAEACEGNRGESPQERELLARVDQTIDRLVAEFNEDVAIFEALEKELRDYIATQRRRFDLAEKRSAEAQQGRERLQNARDTAASDLERSRAGRNLPPVIADFLGHHAAHHLTQVVLREGRESPRYAAAMQTIDNLLVAFDWASEGGASNVLKPLPEAELEEILASSGCAGTAAQAAIDALHEALSRIAEGEAAAADEIRLPEQAAVPEPAPLPPEPVPELDSQQESLDYEPEVLARTRALAVGDWLNLRLADGGANPAKVSWISPISSRLLLVNRRGIRVLVASPDELAAMAKLGKLQLRDADTAFEDAMHQVVDRLKSTVPA